MGKTHKNSANTLCLPTKDSGVVLLLKFNTEQSNVINKTGEVDLKHTGITQSTSNVFEKLDPSFHIVHEAYTMAKTIFEQGRNNYVVLKNRSRRTINTFLDLVQIMNEEMSRELRTAVLKFYKISYFRDFSNYMIAMEEVNFCNGIVCN